MLDKLVTFESEHSKKFKQVRLRLRRIRYHVFIAINTSSCMSKLAPPFTNSTTTSVSPFQAALISAECPSCVMRDSHYTVYMKKIIPCDAKRKKMQNSGQLFRACWPSSAEHTISLASRVYKGYQERSAGGYELMRFIPKRLCSGYQERSGRIMYLSSPLMCLKKEKRH